MDANLLQYLSPSAREAWEKLQPPGFAGVGLGAEFRAALTSLAETRVVLAEHEWAIDDDGDEYCVQCGGFRLHVGVHNPGHKPNCWLARLLHPAGAGEEKHDG